MNKCDVDRAYRTCDPVRELLNNPPSRPVNPPPCSLLGATAAVVFGRIPAGFPRTAGGPMRGGAALPVDPDTLPVSRSKPSQSHILLEFAHPNSEKRGEKGEFR